MPESVKNNSKEYSAVHINDYKGNDTRPKGIGSRHIQIFILFLCLCVIIGTRNNFGVAIVAMTTHSNDSVAEIFDWNKQTQNFVLSSFFWGYVAMQIPAAFIVGKFGGKLPIAVSLIVNGLLSILTPILTHLGGYKTTCALRVIQGLSQGVVLPSIHTLLGVWVPVEERGRLASFTYGGVQGGVLLFIILAGIFCGSNLGWPYLFYTQGVISLIIGGIWCFYGAKNPNEHKSIKHSERIYIQKSLGQLEKKKLPPPPWRKMLTSPRVLAICSAHAGCSWIYQTMSNELPSYLTNIMHTDIQKSGLLTAIPFLTKWFGVFVFSFASDYLVNRGTLTTVQARKLCNSIGSWPTGFLLIGLGYAQDIVLAEAILIIGMTLVSGQNVGFMINHMDLSPNYAGVMMSISNVCGNITPLIAPLIFGVMLTDTSDVSLWRQVFFVTAAVLFITDGIYLIFGSATVQDWNDPGNDKNMGKDQEAATKREAESILLKEYPEKSSENHY